MPVTFHWCNEEKSTVKFIFTDPWSIQEFAECETLVRAEFKHLNHVVDAILDFSDASMMPQNALSYFISSARKGETLENEGASVVYGANLFVQTIGNTIGKIVEGTDIYFATNLDEIEGILENIKAKRHTTL